MKPVYNGFLRGLGVIAFHGTMGLCTFLAASVFGWRAAFVYAIVVAVYMEFKDGN